MNKIMIKSAILLAFTILMLTTALALPNSSGLGDGGSIINPSTPTTMPIIDRSYVAYSYPGLPAGQVYGFDNTPINIQLFFVAHISPSPQEYIYSDSKLKLTNPLF